MKVDPNRRKFTRYHSKVTEAGLEHMKGLLDLQEGFIHGTKETDDVVKKLKEALPKLKTDR